MHDDFPIILQYQQDFKDDFDLLLDFLGLIIVFREKSSLNFFY